MIFYGNIYFSTVKISSLINIYKNKLTASKLQIRSKDQGQNFQLHLKVLKQHLNYHKSTVILLIDAARNNKITICIFKMATKRSHTATITYLVSRYISVAFSQQKP